MTAEEFNNKYKDFLEEGHYGLDIHVPAIVRYLDGVFSGLTKIPGFQYSQIKEKYHSCRFYTNLYELLGNPLDNIISTEIEYRVTLLLSLHSDYLKFSQSESNIL